MLFIFATQFNVIAQFETPETNSQQTTSQKPKVEPPKEPFKDKIVVGGGLDLQFGTITAIGLTPLVGYSVTDNLLVGGILTYRYFRDNTPGFDYSTSTYGVSPFARFFIYKGLFVHVEYEMLYGEFIYRQDPVWVNSFLVGGGYGSRIGKRGFAGVYIMWNLTENPTYPIYTNPIFRMSFGVGI